MRFKLDNQEDGGGKVPEQDGIRCAASSSDGRYLVLGTIRGNLKVAALPTGSNTPNTTSVDSSHRTVQTLTQPPLAQNGVRLDAPASTARACSFAWEDKGLLAGYDDGSIAVWTQQTADPGSSWRLAGCERSAHPARVTCVAATCVDAGGDTPQAQVLAGSHDGTISVWAVPAHEGAETKEPKLEMAMRKVQTLSGGADDSIACIRFFEVDGEHRLYTATVAGQLSIWAWKQQVDSQNPEPEIAAKQDAGAAAGSEWSMERSLNLGPGTHPLLQVVVGDRATVALVRLHSLRVCTLLPEGEQRGSEKEASGSQEEDVGCSSHTKEHAKEGGAADGGWTSSEDLLPAGEGAFIRAAAFDAEATLLAICDWDGFLTLWRRKAPGGAARGGQNAWVRAGCCDAGLREAWSCVFGMGELRSSVMVGSSDGTVAMKSTAEFAEQKCAAQGRQLNPVDVTGQDKVAELGEKVGSGENSANGSQPAGELPPKPNVEPGKSKKEVPRLPMAPPSRLPLKPIHSSSHSRQKQRAKVETLPFKQPSDGSGSGQAVTESAVTESAAESAGRLEAMWTLQGAEEHLSWHTVDPGEVDEWGRCLVSVVRRQKSWESVPGAWWVQACMVRLPSQRFKAGVGPRVGDVVLCRGEKGLHFDAEVLNVRVRKGEQEVKVLFLDGKQDDEGRLVRTFDWIPVANVSRVSKSVSLDFLRARLAPPSDEQPPANRLASDSAASHSGAAPNSNGAEEVAAASGTSVKGCVESGGAVGDGGDHEMMDVVLGGAAPSRHVEGGEGGGVHLNNEAASQPSAGQGMLAACGGETPGQSETVVSTGRKDSHAGAPVRPDEAAAAGSQAAGCLRQGEGGAQEGDSSTAVEAGALSLRQVLQTWATAPTEEVARLKKRLRELHPTLPSEFRILGPRPHVIIDGSGVMKYKVVVHPTTDEPSIEPMSHVEWMAVARSIVSTKSLTRAADAEAYTASFTYARAQLPLTLESTSALAGAVRAREHFHKPLPPPSAPRTHHNQWTKMKERQERQSSRTVRPTYSLLATRLAEAGLGALRGLRGLRGRSSAGDGSGDRPRPRPLTFAVEGDAWWPPSLDHAFLPCWKDAAQRRPNPPAQVVSVAELVGGEVVRVKRKYTRKKKIDPDAALLPKVEVAEGDDQPVLATVVGGTSDVKEDDAAASEHGQGGAGKGGPAAQSKATADVAEAVLVPNSVNENDGGGSGGAGEQDGDGQPASETAAEELPTVVTKTGRVSKLSPKGKKYAMKSKVNPLLGGVKKKKKGSAFTTSTKLSKKQLKKALKAHFSANGTARDPSGASAEPDGLAAPAEPSETVDPPTAAEGVSEDAAQSIQSKESEANLEVKVEKPAQPLIPLGGDLSGPEDAGEGSEGGGQNERPAPGAVNSKRGVKKVAAEKGSRSKIRKITVLKKRRPDAGTKPRKLELKELVQKTKARPGVQKGAAALADQQEALGEKEGGALSEQAAEEGQKQEGGKKKGAKKRSHKKKPVERKSNGERTSAGGEEQGGRVEDAEENTGAIAAEKTESSAKKKSRAQGKEKADASEGKDTVDGQVVDDEGSAQTDAAMAQVVEGSVGGTAKKKNAKKGEGARTPKPGHVDGNDAVDGEGVSQEEEVGAANPSADDQSQSRPHHGKGEGKAKAGPPGSADKGKGKAGKASPHKVKTEASNDEDRKKAGANSSGQPAERVKAKAGKGAASGASLDAFSEGHGNGVVPAADATNDSPGQPSVGHLERLGEGDVVTPDLLEKVCVDYEWMLSNGWDITSEKDVSARPKKAAPAEDVMHLLHMFVYCSTTRCWTGTFSKHPNRERCYTAVQTALKERDYKVLNSALKRMEANITWSCVTPPYEEKRIDFIKKDITGPQDAIIFLRTLITEVLGRAWKVSVLNRMHKEHPILVRFVPDAKPKAPQQNVEGGEAMPDARAVQQEAESVAGSPKPNTKAAQTEDASAKESAKKKPKAERKSKGSMEVGGKEQAAGVDETSENTGASAGTQPEKTEGSAKKKSKSPGKEKADMSEGKDTVDAAVVDAGEGAQADAPAAQVVESSVGGKGKKKKRKKGDGDKKVDASDATEGQDTVDEAEPQPQDTSEAQLAERKSGPADRSARSDERGRKRPESQDAVVEEVPGSKDTDSQNKRKAGDVSKADASPSTPELPTTKSGRVVKPAITKKSKTGSAQLQKAGEKQQQNIETPSDASALGEHVMTELTDSGVGSAPSTAAAAGNESQPPTASDQLQAGIAAVFGKPRSAVQEACAEAVSESGLAKEGAEKGSKAGGKGAGVNGEKEASAGEPQDGANGSKRGKGQAEGGEAGAEVNPSRRRKATPSKKEAAEGQREPNGVVADAGGAAARPSTVDPKADSSAEARPSDGSTEAAAIGSSTAGAKGGAFRGAAGEGSVDGAQGGEGGAGAKRRRSESGVLADEPVWKKLPKNYMSPSELERLVGEAATFLSAEADAPRATRANSAALASTTKSGRKVSAGDPRRPRPVVHGQSAFASPRTKPMSPSQGASAGARAKSTSHGHDAGAKDADRLSGKKARKGGVCMGKEGKHEGSAGAVSLTEGADSEMAAGKGASAQGAPSPSSAAACAELEGQKAPQELQTPVPDVIPETP